MATVDEVWEGLEARLGPGFSVWNRGAIDCNALTTPLEMSVVRCERSRQLQWLRRSCAAEGLAPDIIRLVVEHFTRGDDSCQPSAYSLHSLDPAVRGRARPSWPPPKK